MARINLLPWRDELRKERQKNFLISLAAGVIAAALVMVGVHTYEAQRIEHQNTRNEYLKKQIAELDKEIREIRTLEQQKQKIKARLDIIQRLQASRPEIVHLFDELVRTLPDGVYLTQVTQQGNLITVKGNAQSNGRISNYMWNLEESDWLANPVLDVIENVQLENQRVSRFTLRAVQAKKLPDAQKKEAGS